MNVTRLTIRLEGAIPWTVRMTADAIATVERLLTQRFEYGPLKLTGTGSGPQQKIVGVAVHRLLLAVPKGGELAALQGYLKEEHPFKPGTARHAARIRKFDQGVATLRSDG